MPGFTIFRPLFDRIDTVTQTYVSDMAANATATIAPVVVIGLTIAFLAYGMLIIRGAVQAPVMEFLAKSVKMAFIISVALGGGFYQGQIAQAIRTTPDALAQALVPDQTGQGGQAADMIDTAAGAGLDKMDDAFAKAHAFSFDSVLYVVVGVIVLIATVVLVAIGGAFILLAKLGLAIMAGLGPMFIICLLWQPTQKFFDMWAAQVCGFAMLIVMVAATFGLMLTIFTTFVSGIAFDGVQSIAYNLGGLSILSIAMVIVLMQLPGIASSLGGGVAIGAIHELRTLANGARSAGKAAGNAASGIAAGAAGAAKGIGSFAGSMGGAGSKFGGMQSAGKAAAGLFKSKAA